MQLIPLSAFDLALAAGLILLLAVLSVRMRLRLGKEIVVAALRTTLQLLLIGMVLKALFANVHLSWVIGIAIVMLLIAGREVMARQQYTFVGGWGFGIGTLSMFISSFSIAILSLTVIIGTDPWYTPQYAIPLLGMMLGNTMSGVTLGMDHLTQSAWRQRSIIEARLILGQEWAHAISDIRRDSIRVGMIPIINAMAAAGVVSLPGMMTGQILAGSPPLEAVKYQILVMFLITAGTGFGTMAAVWMGSRRLFDERQRLRLDHLHAK
ncbi:MAG TPA: iron export ABC transporter permease subunit FetB [Gammaproteobacteria bacterium]|nr:iron export ABC transporter permease subunit FetB [Gammaproteobacteria bacterium]